MPLRGPIGFAAIPEDFLPSRIAQANRGMPAVPAGLIGLPIVTQIAPWRGNQSSPRSTERVPASATGTTSRSARAAATNAPRRKGRSPAARVNVPSGEKAKRLFPPGKFDQSPGILGAVLRVEAFHEACTDTAQKSASEELFTQFPLGDKVKRLPKGRYQHEPVEIAGVVGYHDVGFVTRQVLTPLHRNRNSRKTQEQAREPAA